jgi:peptidoglycan hydrolase-like protein with peptidoglycan-binding domain
VRRASAFVAAVIVGASGLILASPGLANASTASCTGFSAFQLVNGAGDGNTDVPTVGTNTFQVACQLAETNDSSAVTVLQQTLNACYGDDLAEDGDFGPATQAAVEAMQADIGVSVDGIYGPNTRTAMKFRPTEGSPCGKLHEPLIKE